MSNIAKSFVLVKNMAQMQIFLLNWNILIQVVL